ncbi:2-amino-4-hydroxy-6-hydroxymethyldihydropteridine diphosphokinase [Aquabacter cavernae]|uniref:2-amino-4-hydroxy-6- hydroxymethyldihydropteridine diphosphokinase n=1 Tax=Aquabacter cavernae TaxID=2496029 RepID=UPI000F8CCD4E|nr:2-amino-4-hydroxy-6-hydroxymethyldihydropteridine diphosphokinase [Aquabacter cavernae]
MSTRAFLCLGGNWDAPERTLPRALVLLEETGLRIGARSALYRTPPWGPVAQPDYVNQVVEVFTDGTPEALLALALDVERRLGRDRTREERFGPRRIDIDILLFGEEVRTGETLALPHPRLLERAFALVPLAEIAPDLEISGIEVRDALRALDRSGIVRLN